MTTDGACEIPDIQLGENCPSVVEGQVGRCVWQLVPMVQGEGYTRTPTTGTHRCCYERAEPFNSLKRGHSDHAR